MSTFNGWTIYTMPSSPVPRSIEWSMTDVVGSARNPFSLRQQTYNWSSGILRASVSFAPMLKPQSLAWTSFLMSVQGISGVFLFGDPLNVGPQNGAASAGAVSGAGQTGYTLVTTSSNLTPGDWIQLGVRLYAVTSVSGGTLGIWPAIRESPADGTSLVINNTQGLFRLSKNDRKFSVDVNKTYGITFEIEEAL